MRSKKQDTSLININITRPKRTKTALLSTVFLMFCACATPQEGYLDEPTEVVNKKFSIKRDHTVVTLPTYEDHREIYQKLASSYKMRGVGDFHIAMAVDDMMTDEERQSITKSSQSIAAAFNTMGVHQTRISIMDVQEANPNLSVIGFATSELTKSTECKGRVMPGDNNKTDVRMNGYRLGCETGNMMLKQVANKDDLLGKDGLGERNDARRASNVIDNIYTPGETQDYLPGFIVSELGGSGG